MADQEPGSLGVVASSQVKGFQDCRSGQPKAERQIISYLFGPMLTYTAATSDTDLKGILDLQRANLPEVLTPEDLQSQGFVTVRHTYEDLKKLNDLEPHLVAKADGQVIGYLLAMTPQSRAEIPVLVPMFELFDTISYGGKAVSDFPYLVVGQVCVDRRYRGQGVLDACYAAYRARMKTRYAFAITEIAAANTRSRRAHERIGFREIHRYTAPDGVEWCIVVWDWSLPIALN